MAFPVHEVTFPADLEGASNGNLTGQLVNVLFDGRGTGRLHKQTARAWAALKAEVFTRFGVTLTVTSLGDAYRSYQNQVAVFTQRYVPYYVAGSTSTKSWNGVQYWLRLGFAMVAVPGTSNHGWGLALDICEVKPGGAIVGIANSVCWNWLLANAHLYGFSWEAQSEPWHIRLFVGDAATQAVLDYERPLPPPVPPTPGYDDEMPTLYRDSRFWNVFLVNGDVTTIGPALNASLIARGVPQVVDTHDQSLISFMRKAQIKTSQLVPSGTPGDFPAPPDLQG